MRMLTLKELLLMWRGWEGKGFLASLGVLARGRCDLYGSPMEGSRKAFPSFS